MRDKLVTLFGGGGFLGRYAAQAMIAEGARLRIAQRDPRSAFFIRTLGGLGQTAFVATDIRRADSVARALDGADMAVNLVGTLAGDFEGLQADGPANIGTAARAAGLSALVHVSAIGADAASPARYARTKGRGEARLRDAFPAATILRPSVVFGREDGFINRFAGLIRALPVVPIIRPDARFQPVYVGDVATAIAAVLGDPARHGGRTYELGGPDVMTMRALNERIAAMTGRSPTFAPLPDAVSGLIARAGFLPGAPITHDQWLMLGEPNVVASDAAGFEALGIAPTPMAAVAPGWLVQYRRQGRFADRPPV